MNYCVGELQYAVSADCAGLLKLEIGRLHLPEDDHVEARNQDGNRDSNRGGNRDADRNDRGSGADNCGEGYADGYGAMRSNFDGSHWLDEDEGLMQQEIVAQKLLELELQRAERIERESIKGSTAKNGITNVDARRDGANDVNHNDETETVNDETTTVTAQDDGNGDEIAAAMDVENAENFWCCSDSSSDDDLQSDETVTDEENSAGNDTGNHTADNPNNNADNNAKSRRDGTFPASDTLFRPPSTLNPHASSDSGDDVLVALYVDGQYHSKCCTSWNIFGDLGSSYGEGNLKLSTIPNAAHDNVPSWNILYLTAIWGARMGRVTYKQYQYGEGNLE
jgi:hypothetical protein